MAVIVVEKNLKVKVCMRKDNLIWINANLFVVAFDSAFLCDAVRSIHYSYAQW